MEVLQQGLPPWTFTAIYASPLCSMREQLRQEIEFFAESNTTPWLLAGDFNETINLSERDHGSDEMARRCFRFNNMIKNNGLIDLGFFGPRFTWSRGNSWLTRKSARLDRALCTSY